MRLASQEHIVPGNDLLERARYLRSVGFDGIELTIAERGVRNGPMWHRQEEIQRVQAETGISVSAICRSVSGLLDADPKARDQAAAELRDAIDFAAAVGALGVLTVPRIGAPALPDLSPVATARELEEKLCVAALRDLGAYAQKVGVLVIVEPLNHYLTKFLVNVDQAVRLCEAANSPGVRLMIDSFHANLEEVSLEHAVRRAGRQLAYVHIAENNRRLPAQGSTDFATLVGTLRGAGYDGWLSLECDLAVGDLRTAFDAAAETIKRAIKVSTGRS